MDYMRRVGRDVLGRLAGFEPQIMTLSCQCRTSEACCCLLPTTSISISLVSLLPQGSNILGCVNAWNQFYLASATALMTTEDGLDSDVLVEQQPKQHNLTLG